MMANIEFGEPAILPSDKGLIKLIDEKLKEFEEAEKIEAAKKKDKEGKKTETSRK